MKKLLIAIPFILASSMCLAQKDSLQTIHKDTTIATIPKQKELKGAVVTVKKDPIVRTADRTIFDFSQQANLNSGSLMDGLKKLPGLIISDVAGMMYQGKQLEVYLDGRPLNIYSDELNSYLNSMPANSVERVEIVTQPGAEFPATSGGAIINIISSRYYKKYMSTTYSTGYQFSNYEKFRSRLNNNIMIQAGNKLFSWQVRVGQSYTERFQNDDYSIGQLSASKNFSDITQRHYFLESGIKFDIKKDRVIFNYKLGTNNNRSDFLSEGIGFTTQDQSQTLRTRHDLVLDYQKRFEDIQKKLDFKFNYINTNGDYDLVNHPSLTTTLDNNYNRNFYQLKTDYTQAINLLDESKFLVGVLAEKVDFVTESFAVENMDYEQNTLAAYAEAQTKYSGFEFILGGRVESYDLGGETNNGSLIPFQQTRFFPNATLQYNIAPQVFANINFNQKISLPSTSDLNPNNTVYQNPNINFMGNPNLQPTIFTNYSAGISVYEYFTLGYNGSRAEDQIIFRIQEDGNSVVRTYANIPNCTTDNFYVGVPFPYMIFTQGLKKTLEFDFNPDEINFLYGYFGYNKQNIPDIETKGVWYVYLMSQIILPGKVNFTATYNTSTTGGNYYYISAIKPFQNSIDLNFSKKFDSDRLTVSIFAYDILNKNQRAYGAVETSINLGRNFDSRRGGISISYKIPTRRKLESVPVDILLEQSKSNEGKEIK